MFVKDLGFEPNLFGQNYLELLFQQTFPKAKLNDITPCIINAASVAYKEGVCYYGMLRCSDVMFQGYELLYPAAPYWRPTDETQQQIPQYQSDLYFWDSTSSETNFIGWKVTFEGEISGPPVVDPPAPSEGDLSSLISAQIFLIAEQSPMRYDIGIAYALVRINQYVKNVAFVHNGFFYELDNPITADLVQVISANETLPPDEPPVDSFVGVRSVNPGLSVGYGSVIGSNVPPSLSILPFSYVSSGKFTFDVWDDNTTTCTIQPKTSGGADVGGAVLVFQNGTYNANAGGTVAYYVIDYRISLDGSWYQIPLFKIKK